ncbi:DoxX family membrane protein [Parabacteroides sp. 52]|uniref:DoxX family membrane protein n=1 Tax=unclassified Parabacteroides TaxID=2649774 RepID=UPI0013D27FF8|nr:MULTISPECIES: DoxX family membrane protein [unclassified Parabacteroides]MDH6534145.1 thiosulfate dehydrogenase [quinone] large subunit [Parabacteroides sp. PM5-20]NDV54952.1 DoxX family membrane protein [Parabacteroides sp. 52]
MKTDPYYTQAQLFWLMLLRLFIGWHFMYEGLVKLMNPHWTSLPYLLDSKGPAASFFIELTQHSALMNFINLANEWTLLLVGLGLTLGVFYRLSSVGGMILLLMYTLSHPSFIGADYMMPFEGSYLWIDKNMVEFAALGLLCVFRTSHIYGIDRILKKKCPVLQKFKLI